MTAVRPIYGRIEVRGDEPTNKSMFKTAVEAAIRPAWVDAADRDPGCLQLLKEYVVIEAPFSGVQYCTFLKKLGTAWRRTSAAS